MWWTNSAFVLGCLFLTPAFAGGGAGGETRQIGIPDFHEVSPGIYRGARPYSQGMIDLAHLGIKTDIDLDNDPVEIKRETDLGRTLNINVLSFPMSAFETPDDDAINRVLKIMVDPSQLPVFVHCQYGHDRTGVVFGVYRVEIEKWSPGRAYQEMLDLGFHPIFTKLVEFFEKRSGFLVPSLRAQPAAE